MLSETLRTLFKRDLNKLKKEIVAYQNEAIIWHVEKNISNSAGNLCLHLIGNLNTFIGAHIGHSGYIRQRELEFSSKNIPSRDLIDKIEETMSIVDTALDGLTDEQLQEEYPVLVFKTKTSIELFLVHLTTHLSYHLGQINYHRRMME